jgi:hypothetical protein
MGEIIAERIEDHNATKEVSFYVAHSQSPLYESTDFLRGFREGGVLCALYGKRLL